MTDNKSHEKALHHFFGIHVPFLALLNVRGLAMSAGQILLEFQLLPQFTNSLGATHGGVIATLLDVAMAGAARSEDESYRVITIDMSIQYLRPAIGTLRAQGELLHTTKSLAFCEATLTDVENKMCARASGTFKRLRPENATQLSSVDG